MESCKVVLFDGSILTLRLKNREDGLSLSQTKTYEPEAKSLVYFSGDEILGFEAENDLFLDPDQGWNEIFYVWSNGREIKKVISSLLIKEKEEISC